MQIDTSGLRDLYLWVKVTQSQYIYYYYYTCIYNTHTFSTESEALAVTRWTAW